MEQGSPAGWLFERLTLDPILGRVFWLKPNKYHSEKAGAEAGCERPQSNGKRYWVVRIEGRAYKRGRIVFCMVHGRWPDPCVDHINGDSLDDRPENLREATFTENAWNHKRRMKASPLPMGVRALGAKFQARIACHKVMHYLGTFGTADEASAAYQRARKEMFREFA